MTIVNPMGPSFKYASGQKMGRISIDIKHKQCKRFKQILLLRNNTMAGVLRPFIESYINDNWSPEIR